MVGRLSDVNNGGAELQAVKTSALTQMAVFMTRECVEEIQMPGV
ncbi:hypothetical protein PATSB16_09300 [Pandoraea thiooxydans]|nr:hypothetical protein PATSB16_09300 [Pandoraea thiooxydans]